MSSYPSHEIRDFYEELSSDLLCICDSNLIINYANKHFKVAYSLSETLNRSIIDFIPKEVIDDHLNPKNGVSKNFSTTIGTSKNHVFWSLNYDAEHKQYLFTGKKIGLKDFKINSLNFRYIGLLVDALNEGFLVLDESWNIIYCNKTAEKGLERSLDELIHLNFLTLFPKTKESIFYQEFYKAFDERKLVSFDVYAPTLKKWFKLIGIPYQQNLIILSREITHQVFENKTKELEVQILERHIEDQYSFGELMTQLLEGIEQIYPDMYTTILRIEDSKVYHVAAPRIPESYLNILDGSKIGPKEGSCGTAAYTKKTVIVEDIETDELWRNYKGFILPHGFKSCWSVPVISTKELQVLATFAIYYKENRKPGEKEFITINRISNFIRLLIEDNLKENMLQTSNSRYEMVSNATNDVIYDFNFKTNEVFWNNNVFKLFGYQKKEIDENLTWWDNNIHPEDRNKILSEMERVKAHQIENWSADYRFKCKDGTYKHVVDRAVLRYDLDLNPLNMIGSMQDVNDLKLRELSIIQQNEKLKEIAQISSHDLRRPVTSILGLISLFDQENQSDNAQVIEYLAYATKELDEVIHTIVAKTLEADHTIYLKNAKII
ncbi:MAG: PAS domain-containing protein [Bacteroidetes bacterium]|nr:PAS domain-containing protein [Bacteroidota bacterium]MBU1484445.1 PAS domain-containing protein [Bacteroidota bacterium]MBU2269003.1 PAS domain-containing protein [Bacteroidota bacterium]MBU2376406.1 PAS domain-containing protein [Bacteroidota bacterium]